MIYIKSNTAPKPIKKQLIYSQCILVTEGALISLADKNHSNSSSQPVPKCKLRCVLNKIVWKSNEENSHE